MISDFSKKVMLVPENVDVLYNAVSEGVKNGVIGIREGSEVYYKQKEIFSTMDSVILRGEIAKEETEKK